MNSLTFKTFFISLFNLILVQYVRSSRLGQGRVITEQSVADSNNIFTHEVYLVNQETFCSGSIIGEKHILTAAHCVVKQNSSEIIDIDQRGMIVEAGITNLHSLKELHTFRIVKKVYVPKKYYHHHDASKSEGDIAVLELNNRLGLKINPGISSLNYLDTDDRVYEKSSYTVTGFGATETQFEWIPYLNESDYVPKNFPTQLRYAEVDVVSFSECSKHYSINPTEQLCATVVNSRGIKAGVCRGDSGGALLDFSSNTIIGVVSYGTSSCDDRLTPTVYTKVKHYIHFIDEALADTPNPNYIQTRSFEHDPFYEHYSDISRKLYHEITDGKQRFFDL